MWQADAEAERTPLWVFGVFGLLYLGFCLWYWPFVADDAFIVGRYALNAADGLGLVYNPGEQVSALTSPLHALLETALALISDDPVTLYRVLVLALPPLACWGAARCVGLTGRRLMLFLAFGLCSPFLALWTVGGLETPILAATC